MEKTAQLLELPADVLAGVPRLELIGDSELRGPEPYYNPESRLMREQQKVHGTW